MYYTTPFMFNLISLKNPLVGKRELTLDITTFDRPILVSHLFYHVASESYKHNGNSQNSSRCFPKTLRNLKYSEGIYNP